MSDFLVQFKKFLMNNLERFVIVLFLIVLIVIVYFNTVGSSPEVPESTEPPAAPNLSLPNEFSNKVVNNMSEPPKISDSEFNQLVSKNIFDSKETKSQEEIERELSEKVSKLKDLWKTEKYDEIIAISTSILKQYPTHSIANQTKVDSEKILNTMSETDKLLNENKIDEANAKYEEIIKEMPDRNILKKLKMYIDIKNLEVQRNFQEMSKQVEEGLKKLPNDEGLLKYRERAQLGLAGKLPVPTPVAGPPGAPVPPLGEY